MANEEITLQQFLVSLWRAKWMIAAVAAGFAAAAAVAASFVPKTYRSTLVVALVSDSGASGQLAALGSIASQFGLGSLAGLGGQQSSRAAESLAVLQSRTLIEGYIRDNDLLPVLYANLWDPQNRKWKTARADKAPTLWKGGEYFSRKILNVRTDPKTGLVQVTVTWKDSKMAATWANGLAKLANQVLRAKAIEESDRNVAYLTEQAAKTGVVEARQTIYKLLENELYKVMLARGTEEYAFKVLDPAAISEKPYAPRFSVWVVAALVGGAFAASLLVLIKESFRKSARSA
jgi:uncharacterized protein involved in exopolysaccharide biosynthesis